MTDVFTAGSLARITAALSNRRVIPDFVPGRLPSLPTGEEPSAADSEPDDTSSWSIQICYEDAQGEPSERRITCRRLEGHGRAENVLAFCHERVAWRSFKIARITALFDLSTGEERDPFEYFDMLRAMGMPLEDKSLANFSKLLVFMIRCDGQAHKAEWTAIEEALMRYALRFDGDDETVVAASRKCRAIAPDSVDIIKVLKGLARASHGPKMARLALESCAAVVDADGVIAPEEVHWSAEVSDALKRIAMRS